MSGAGWKVAAVCLLALLTPSLLGEQPAGCGATLEATPKATSAPAPISFRQVLERAGIGREDLAVGAEPDFLGHPPLSSVPFVLPHVRSARRDPLRLVALGENLSAVARRMSNPEPVEESASRLLPTLTAFLLQPRLPSSFRGFSPRPLPPASDPTPRPDRPELPESLGGIVDRLVAEILRAADRVESSWRRVPRTTVEVAVSAREVPRLLPEGSTPWSALEDAARGGDEVDRAGAFVGLAVAIERAVRELETLDVEALSSTPQPDRWEWETPRGRVIVAGPGNHEHLCLDDCLLIVDLGGEDIYRGTVAGARFPQQLVAVSIDLEGDDRYYAEGAAPAQGTGLGGLGALVDAGGDDLYEAGDGAQGFGLLGYGLLWDRSGDDRYRARGGAQGSAVFGGGLLVDGRGADDYRLLGEGQGYGGPGGCGALVDLEGDDIYRAESEPRVATGRADYHSQGRVAANFAQGAGAGRRGDLSDGRSWGGGLGVLADLAGDDSYTAGNFAQGLGFWLGTGMLLDSGGNDVYRSVYFSQGSGAHFSLALLLDRGGDDRHLLEGEAAASLGYGWDFAASVLVSGGGDDVYAAKNTVVGVAERSSVALFLELGGNDRYRVPLPDGGGRRTLGAVDANPRGLLPGDPLRAAGTANLVGLFVDLGGEDRYPGEVLEPAAQGTPGNRHTWLWRGPASGETTGLRRGVGLDLHAPSPEDLPMWLLARKNPVPLCARDGTGLGLNARKDRCRRTRKAREESIAAESGAPGEGTP